MAAENMPWLNVKQGAARAQVSISTILREARPLIDRKTGQVVRPARLRSVKVGGRRNLRFRPEWIDSWLLEQSPEFAAERTPLRIAGR
jgi:hypothetical protein